MKTRLLVLFALCMTISFYSCNKEDSLLHQEEDATVVELQDDPYADLPESVRSLISSLVISPRAYPPECRRDLSHADRCYPSGRRNPFSRCYRILYHYPACKGPGSILRNGSGDRYYQRNRVRRSDHLNHSSLPCLFRNSGPGGRFLLSGKYQ